MARNWYGQKRIIKEDKYTRKSNQYSEWEITKEKLKIVIWLILGYGYFHFIVMGWGLLKRIKIKKLKLCLLLKFQIN